MNWEAADNTERVIQPMVSVPRFVEAYDAGRDFADRWTAVFPDRTIYTMTDEGKYHYEGKGSIAKIRMTHRKIERVPEMVLEAIRNLMP